MSTQALGWALAGGLVMSTLVSAEPINDLQTRLTTMRNDQKTRMEVEVELRHRGSAPLHLNKEKKRGMAVIEAGPEGVKNITSRWLGTSSRFSFWRKGDHQDESPLMSFTEADALVDPSGMMEALLSEAVLVSDESVTWEGRPARLLVIRPFAAVRKVQQGESAEPERFDLDAKVWLDESGVPLALERGAELRLGPILSVTEVQSYIFQQVEGRLLVAEARETWSGTGLAVLRGRDDRKVKVVAVN